MQRTAWIYHLLANDFYARAMAQSDRRHRTTDLTRAGEVLVEARKYGRPEGGEGFDQCIPTTILAEKIAEALDPSRDPTRDPSRDPTGGVQTRAR